MNIHDCLVAVGIMALFILLCYLYFITLGWLVSHLHLPPLIITETTMTTVCNDSKESEENNE